MKKFQLLSHFSGLYVYRKNKRSKIRRISNNRIKISVFLQSHFLNFVHVNLTNYPFLFLQFCQTLRCINNRKNDIKLDTLNKRCYRKAIKSNALRTFLIHIIHSSITTYCLSFQRGGIRRQLASISWMGDESDTGRRVSSIASAHPGSSARPRQKTDQD